jgi:hypothetical protein
MARHGDPPVLLAREACNLTEVEGFKEGQYPDPLYACRGSKAHFQPGDMLGFTASASTRWNS